MTKHAEVEKLWYDISVPARALECTEKNTREYMETLSALSRALTMVDFLEPRGEDFYESVKAADAWLEDNFYSKCRGNGTSAVCIGHTHIDVAWLWPIRQTREKAQRSFATVIELMKRYPEYRFMSSQAYLYKTVKEDAPELYREIKKMVAAGRWEVEGAMWLEADCNLPSGESLVRQIIYGKRFFKEEFGVDSRVLWLPDVFGYSAALPQILKKSGVDWFVTSKISWNDMNIMPYDLFRWRGIDGTAVPTYFLTAQKKGRDDSFSKGTTYNANTNPEMIAGTYNRFQQKDLSDEAHRVNIRYQLLPGRGGVFIVPVGGPVGVEIRVLPDQLEHNSPGISGFGYLGGDVSEVDRSVAGDQVFVLVEDAVIVVYVEGRELMTEDRHVVPSRSEAELVSAVPAEARGLGEFLEGKGEVGEHPLVLVADEDVRLLRDLHQLCPAGVAGVVDVGRVESRREVDDNRRYAVERGLFDRSVEARGHVVAFLAGLPDVVDLVEGGVEVVAADAGVLKGRYDGIKVRVLGSCEADKLGSDLSASSDNKDSFHRIF